MHSIRRALRFIVVPERRVRSIVHNAPGVRTVNTTDHMRRSSRPSLISIQIMRASSLYHNCTAGDELYALHSPLVAQSSSLLIPTQATRTDAAERRDAQSILQTGRGDVGG
jgi:hypothetical protein